MLKSNRQTIIWVLTGIIIVLFWFSLRDKDHGMEYTLAALGVWGVAYLTNNWLKNEKKEKEKEE